MALTRKEIHARYYRKHREKVLERTKQYQRENPHVARAAKLLRCYGMTQEEYDARLAEQGGGCAICGRKPEDKESFCVDHDHTTMTVRGILCLNCNAGIGQLRDDPELVRKAWEYLNGI